MLASAAPHALVVGHAPERMNFKATMDAAASGPIASFESVSVKYDGFVEVVVAGTSKPGRAQVELAAEMLKKKNLKTTQKLHPLYGRKVKGVLTLSLLADRILCQMKRKPDRSGEGVVLEMLFRRIATVGAVGDAIYIVCRRPSDPNGAFNCHKITLQKGPSKAEELAFFLSVYAKNDFMAGSQTPTTPRRATMATPQRKNASPLSEELGGFGGLSFSPSTPAATPAAQFRGFKSGSSEVEFFSPEKDGDGDGDGDGEDVGDVPQTPASPGCADLELQDQFGFGDSSVLHASMLEHDHDLDLTGFSNSKASAGVPQSWLSPELPKRIQGLFSGFGGESEAAAAIGLSSSPTKRREGDIRSRSLPGSPKMSPKVGASDAMPFFASELSKRVLGLFPGFGKDNGEEGAAGADGEHALKRSPQSQSLRYLNADIRRDDEILTPLTPLKGRAAGAAGAGAAAGAAGAATSTQAGVKAIPTFGSELSRRVQGLFTGFDSSPFRRVDQKSIKLQHLDAEIKKVKPSMFASCPDLSSLGGSSCDVLDGVDLEELKGFSSQMRYLGKVSIPEEMNGSEESFGRINAAKDHLRTQNGNCTVNMTVSATHVNFESLADGALALWFSRTLNDIVRIDRTDETWVTITFTPEANQGEGEDEEGGFDDSFFGGGDEEEEVQEGSGGHIVQVFDLPTEEEAMDLCATLTKHLGESNNLFV